MGLQRVIKDLSPEADSREEPARSFAPEETHWPQETEGLVPGSTVIVCHRRLLPARLPTANGRPITLACTGSWIGSRVLG